VRFKWIDQHRQAYDVSQLCEQLQVSRAGYYAWRTRPQSVRRTRRLTLIQEIKTVYLASRQTYGSPRVHAELAGRRVGVCLNTVSKLMREEGLNVVKRKKFVPQTTDSTHPHPIAPNRLDRDFASPAPDRKWASDLTYLWTDQGWLFLAVVIDLYSRKVVGWSLADHMRGELTRDALTMALRRRGVGRSVEKERRPLMHHSDRGVQYACGAYRALLAERGIEPSMSRKGDCWDNAATESFFATLKKECVYRQAYATRAAARQSVFEWIEVFYNRQRRHSSLGYLSPEVFEAQNT
jgi:putative transposase